MIIYFWKEKNSGKIFIQKQLKYFSQVEVVKPNELKKLKKDKNHKLMDVK